MLEGAVSSAVWPTPWMAVFVGRKRRDLSSLIACHLKLVRPKVRLHAIASAVCYRPIWAGMQAAANACGFTTAWVKTVRAKPMGPCRGKNPFMCCQDLNGIPELGAGRIMAHFTTSTGYPLYFADEGFSGLPISAWRDRRGPRRDFGLCPLRSGKTCVLIRMDYRGRGKSNFDPDWVH